MLVPAGKEKMQLRQTATFVVEIKNLQHETWQGTVWWVQGEKKSVFKGGLKLLQALQEGTRAMVEPPDEENGDE